MTAHVPCRVCRIWPKVPFVPEGTSSELLQFRNLKMRTKLETAKSSQFHKLINPHQRLFYFEGFFWEVVIISHHHHLVQRSGFRRVVGPKIFDLKRLRGEKKQQKVLF